jgi:MOSC domain-containing protein YiiM
MHVETVNVGRIRTLELGKRTITTAIWKFPEVRQPRLPCFKLGLRHSDPLLPGRFARAGRPGAYLAIIEPGVITPGDRIEVLDRPDHDVTVTLVAHIYLHEHGRARELLDAPALPDGWRAWALERSG